MQPRNLLFREAHPVFALLVFLFLFTNVHAQQQARDVVYLKNGSVIKGIIIEQIPNESIKIKTGDGNIFVYKTDEIEKITREEAPSVQPAGAHRGFFVGPILAPAETLIYLSLYDGNSSAPGFDGAAGLSVCGYLTDHVGISSGMELVRYSTTYSNVPVESYTTQNLYGYSTNGYYYGNSTQSLTYLTFPLLLSILTSKPSDPGFYVEVGPEFSVLLAAKDKITGSQVNSDENDNSGIISTEIYGDLRFGLHEPLGTDRVTLDFGPYCTAGLLNLYTAEYSGSGSTQGRSFSLGLSARVLFNVGRKK